MIRRRPTRIPITPSSGNVFADIGLPDPEEVLARAQVASDIWQTIKRQRLGRADTARRMKIDQPEVAALLDGRLGGFSSSRLKLLWALLIKQ